MDAGYAQTLKSLIAKIHQEWLDYDDNADRWFNNVKPYTAMERRVLITHWVGDAWERLNAAKYDRLRSACWTATGCLLTADGSDDHLVKPEGLPEFKVPPPTTSFNESQPKTNLYEVSPFVEEENALLTGFDGEKELVVDEEDVEIEQSFGIIDQIILS